MNVSYLRQLLAVFFVMFAVASHGAAEADIAPDQLVEKITQKLVSEIDTYRDAMAEAAGQAEKDALLEDFYQSITETLEPVVDFHWISLNVMGQYRQQASEEQQAKFTEVFTEGLVETYGRGLLTYSDQNIVVLPLSDDQREQRRVIVRQEIRSSDKTYPLQYSMGLNRDGEWKVINVVINGINLGKTFRNQFTQAAARYDGDIDKVIANWSVSVQS